MRRALSALLSLGLASFALACQPATETSARLAASNAEGVAAMPVALAVQKGSKPVIEKIVKSEEEWKKLLTPEQFQVLRKQGTERAFTGEYWNNHEKGVY